MFLKTKIFSYHIQRHLILDIFAFTMKLKEYASSILIVSFARRKLVWAPEAYLSLPWLLTTTLSQ